MLFLCVIGFFVTVNQSYFERPRYHIALTLMWRKVDGRSGSLAERECNAEGHEYFFTPATKTVAAVPKAPYLGMLDRGWRPLKAENFELSSGYNLCSKQFSKLGSRLHL